MEDLDIRIYSGLCVVEELSSELLCHSHVKDLGNIPAKQICCIGEVASAVKQY